MSISLDRPGFIVNRILMPMINEAFFVLMEARLICLSMASVESSLSITRKKTVEAPDAGNCQY